jgi:hypothetical protein
LTYWRWTGEHGGALCTGANLVLDSMVLSKKLADGGLSGKIGGEDFRWLKPQPTQRAHELIDRMAPGQIAAVVGLMEILLDPVARSLANAPFDDE